MSDEEANITINMGAPAWVVTFGDLMSLLLCFFVLLLSFSEMDKAKYKEVAGSLEKAFGVSYETRAMNIPKGVTLVAKDFDQPLVPTFSKDEYVTMGKKKDDKADGKNILESQFDKDEMFKKDLKKKREAVGEKLKKEIEESLKEIEENMQHGTDIKKLIDVEVGENEVTIRMMGETAFDSGHAEIRDEMRPLLKKIATILNEQEGEITIIGHTDNVPILGGEYKTNLGLSMARAASVANNLLNKGYVAPQRISTMGFGEYRPIETNDTSEGRQKNRRVEIKLKSVSFEKRKETQNSSDIETDPEQKKMDEINKFFEKPDIFSDNP